MDPATSEPTGQSSGQVPDIAPPPMPPQSAPSPMTLPLPAPPAGSKTPDAPDGAAGAVSAAQITDDGDVIEKDWVDKAKRIAVAYRNDPYRQSEEMTIFKANYMKKRYGKDIKLK